MKKLIQKLSVGICMLSISTAASFASIAAEITQDDLAKTPATEATIEQPEMDVLQHVSSELQNSFVNGDAKEPLKLIEEFTSSVDNETLDSAKERGTWAIKDAIFNGTGTLAESNTMDMYIVQTSKDTASALKIVSENGNLTARIYLLDTATGQATATNIYDQAGDETASILGTLPAGNYALAVSSASQSALTGDYTLMWNCANPGGAGTLISYNQDLTSVVLGYTTPSKAIYCNGEEWLKDLKWEEHYTFSYDNGYTARDQSVYNVQVKQINLGFFTSNKYNTSNALFVEVGVGTGWSIMRSQYQNNMGDVTHTMDWYDATGQKTPCNFDEADIKLGPHYIVIDLNTNQVVDFASPYNYLWLTGDTKGSATFTQTDIL